jgi:NitT/TauT family transport system ATP-binding protein
MWYRKLVLLAMSVLEYHRAMQGILPHRREAGVGVRVEGVRRVYDNRVVALDGIDLDVAPGEFLAILGPSGCGKSTLLRLIAGLDQPQSGTVCAMEAVHGKADRHGLGTRAEIAYVFQDAHLLPWRDVLSNVALPLELMGVGRAARRDASRRAIEQVGLGDAIDRYPAQLSGGMRMRVSLARAMVTEPKLLLMDEPFAALDEITRQRLDDQLRGLWAKWGMTIIFVTHSTTEAVFLAERAVVMSRRMGRIVEDTPIELPRERTAPLRSTPEFAAQTQAIYRALEESEK